MSDQSHEHTQDETVEGVLEPQEDPGLHHLRGSQHGGMPLRLNDDELALAVERDRVAAGLADYVPPATDPLPEGTPEVVDLAQRGLLGDTTAE